MKTTTLNKLIILSFISFSVFWSYSCKKDRIESQELEQYSSIDNYFNQKKQHEQEYQIDSTGQNPLIGEQGTKIWLNKSKLMYQNGDSVYYPYTVKLIELYTIKDMVYYQMPSTSQSTLLTTEGVIRLRAFKNGEELVLRQGAQWPIEMPDTSQLQDMKVYYGSGNPPSMTWTQNGSFTNTSYGYSANISPLGWVACDKPIDMGGTSVINFTSSTADLNTVSIFIYIPELQMLEKVSGTQSTSLPSGYQAKVFAIAINSSNQLFKFYQEVNIGLANLNLEVTLSQSSDSEIENMLNNL